MKNTLITGASSGFGIYFAHIAAKAGHSVILTARRIEILENLAIDLHQRYQVTVDIIQSDLGTSTGAQQLIQEIENRGLQVDTLINNAGFGDAVEFQQASPTKLDSMIHLNILSLTQLCRHFLPAMVQEKQGGILNIASIAAFQPGPGMATYFATKSYVHSLTRALRYETKAHNIKVTALCPGPTSTEFGKNAGIYLSNAATPFSPSAYKVALSGWNALRKNKAVHVPGFLNYLTTVASTLMPYEISTTLSGYLFKKLTRTPKN
jgi:uncharacterized protein